MSIKEKIEDFAQAYAVCYQLDGSGDVLAKEIARGKMADAEDALEQALSLDHHMRVNRQLHNEIEMLKHKLHDRTILAAWFGLMALVLAVFLAVQKFN